MTAETLSKCCDATEEKEIDFMLDAYERRSPQDKGKKLASLSSSSAPSVTTTKQPQQSPESLNDPHAPYSYATEDIVWRNVFLFIWLHTLAVYGIFLIATGHVKWQTTFTAYLYGMVGAVGVTAGCHRLWAHSAYKARWPLRCLLMVMQTIAFQNSVWEWVRDHRVHHKFTDTNADPHNYSRGFFFAHMGWLMVRKHPMVKTKGAGIDMSDIERDPVCAFQKKYYLILMPFFAFVVPIVLLHAVDGSWENAILLAHVRYFVSLHYSWLVNSASHYWGDKPFDKAIKPTDNGFLAFFTIGEGWHNYHHVFPWDYKAAELGNYALNITTSFIDAFAWLGWAYDLKVVSDPMICKRALRTGDGSWQRTTLKAQTVDEEDDEKKMPPAAMPSDASAVTTKQSTVELVNMDYESMLWGWNDKDLPEQAKQYVEIRNKQD